MPCRSYENNAIAGANLIYITGKQIGGILSYDPIADLFVQI